MSSHSTGPTSEAGMERSSLNAVKHGLRSERPVLPGEDPAEWDAFRSAIVADLAPASALEAELADRVALQLWRLRRAARYEAQVSADQCTASGHAAAADPFHLLRPELPAERALNDAFLRLRDLKDEMVRAEAVRQLAQQLPSLPDDEPLLPAAAAQLLTLLSGVLWDDLSAPNTAEDLRQEVAEELNLPVPEALTVAAQQAEDASRQLANVIADCGTRIAFLRKQLSQQAASCQHDSRLLQRSALDRVVRYEAHVSRQLNQALQLLRQFKEERRAQEETRAGSVSDGAAAQPSLTLPALENAGEPPAPRQEADTTRSFGTLRRPASPVAERHESDGFVQAVVTEPPEVRRNGTASRPNPDTSG
jgi:hypothetical protein